MERLTFLLLDQILTEQALTGVISPQKSRNSLLEKKKPQQPHNLIIYLEPFSITEDIWVWQNSLLHEFFTYSAATTICIIMKLLY